MAKTKQKNSPVGPLSSKRRVKVAASLVLVVLVWADHAHLCDVIVLVRPLQKRVYEPQSRNALEGRGGGRYHPKKEEEKKEEKAAILS